MTTDIHVASSPEETFDPEHRDVLDVVLRLLDRSGHGQEAALDGGLLEEVASAGLIGVSLPEDWAGAGLNDLRFGAAMRTACGRVGALGLGTALTELTHVALPLLETLATDELRTSWYEKLVAGKCRVAVALRGQVKARQVNGTWRLTGTARAQVNVATADLLLVLATTEEGQLLGVVDARSEDATPDALALLGTPAFGLAALQLKNATPLCHTTDAATITAALARATVDQELLLATGAVEDARTAVRWALEYATERTAFGSPIASFQNSRLVLGDVATAVDAAAAVTAAALLRRVGGATDTRSSAVALLAATRALDHAVDVGLQLHGGYGYMKEYPISQLYLDARTSRLIGIRCEQHRREAAAPGA